MWFLRGGYDHVLRPFYFGASPTNVFLILQEQWIIVSCHCVFLSDEAVEAAAVDLQEQTANYTVILQLNRLA